MKTPKVGQTLKWIEAMDCDSKGNRNFLKAQRRKYPGKLKIAALVRPPRGSRDKKHFHVTHNGETITDSGNGKIPAQFSPYWFRLGK